MKRRIFLAFALLVMAVASLSAQQRYEKNLGSFQHIRVLNAVPVEVVCNPDSAGKVVFFAKDEAVSRILFENNSKGRLTIQTDNTVNPVKLPLIKVYAADLKTVENGSDSTLVFHAGNQKYTEIKLKTSGNGVLKAVGLDAVIVDASINTGSGKIILQGKCQELEASNVGKGVIDAFDLDAGRVAARIVGTGEVSCFVNGGTLNLRGSGSGKLYYKGKPANIEVKQLGTLRAIPVE